MSTIISNRLSMQALVLGSAVDKEEVETCPNLFPYCWGDEQA